MDDVLKYALQFMDRLPALIQIGVAGADLAKIAAENAAKIRQFQAEGRNPTEVERNEQNARLDVLEKRLQAP